MGLDWDTRSPKEIEEAFEAWRSTLEGLESLVIPRWFATPSTTNGKPELHVFSDASLEGYGVTAYIRWIGENGEVHVSNLFSRAHVVPIDMLKKALKDQENHHNSMPRLELTAACLAAKVRDMIVREIGFPFHRIVMWSDSECVLKWINDMDTRFPTFIKNRLTKIHELTKAVDWRYVPTDLNPADDCS